MYALFVILIKCRICPAAGAAGTDTAEETFRRFRRDRSGKIIRFAILLTKETSSILKKLFPGARYYRYGGDEFLVLTYKPAQDNYGATTYDFTHENGIKVSLSIGSAQGNPAGYDELFELVSKADKALYTVKERTHSLENGGNAC